jgi:hypothetical protein
MKSIRWGLVFLIVAIALPALAATGRRLSFEQLCAGADGIAIVETLSVRSFELDGRILTATTFAVKESLKGKLSPTVEVIQLGGRTKHLATRVAGMPTFVPGEKAVVFLERPGDSTHFVIYGLEQGKLPIQADQVMPALVTMHLLGADGSDVLPFSEPAMSLPSLRTRISKAKVGEQ